MTTKRFSLSSIALLVYLINAYSSLEATNSCSVAKINVLLQQAAHAINEAQNYTKGVESELSCRRNLCMTTKPSDCEDVLLGKSYGSGTYDIWPQNRIFKGQSIKVFCDMTTDGGGWTVFQRRGDFGRAKDFFYKGWNEYRDGFGRISHDFWLGNDAIYAISNQKQYSLRIDMEDVQKDKRYALYDSFWIDSEELNYKLHVSGFTGNAGDSFSGHNEYKFTTKDRKNDIHTENCATVFKGGWWYSKCHGSNLNGLYLNGTHTSYADGIEWSAWKGYNYSLPVVEMKIRSSDFKNSTETTYTTTPKKDSTFQPTPQ